MASALVERGDASGDGLARIVWTPNGLVKPEPIPSTRLCWTSGASWPSFCVEEHTSAFGVLPQGSFAGHLIALNVGSPYRVEVSWSGVPAPAESTHLPGNVIFTPASMRVSATWRDPATVVLVEISPDAFATRSGPQTEVPLLGPVFNCHDRFIAHVVLALRDLASDPHQLGAAYGESLCSVLCEYLGTNFRRGDPERMDAGRSALSSGKLRRVLEYVEAHLDQDITLHALAHESGTSPFHFARIFKRRTGLAPHQFIVRRRMERARTLLSDGDLSILEVSLQCGYSQQSHFAATFRRLVGMSPSAYRRLI
jgi:AraC family transcriptional regulator